MKFPQPNMAQTHTLHIPSLTGGLNYNENPHNSKIFYLQDCKNIWNEKGLLKTRPGISTSASRRVYTKTYETGYYKSYKLKDLQMELDGELRQLCLELIEYDLSLQVCMTHFLSSDGTIYKSAALEFPRTSDEVFYIPKTVNFFKGKPQNGSGLFAVIGLVNCENYTETDAAIFELSQDFSVWNYAISPYVPTILVNGRGNNYELAKGTNQAFTGTPTRVEGLNILNDTFYAYFSTDGRSSSFKLPLANLSSKAITGRFYYKYNSYVEWIVGEGKTGATATVYDVTVTMNVDREKGIVYFTVPAGEYEVPLVSFQNENNLRITASKDSGYSLLDMACGDAAANVNDKILIGNKNIIFEAKYSNPLYFPIDSIALAGAEDSSIRTFVKKNKNIFAFKENEIYEISISSGKKLSGVSVPNDNKAEFYNCDSLYAEYVAGKTGCKKETDFALFDNNLYWIAPDFRVNSLNQSGKVTVLSGQPDIELLLNLNSASTPKAKALNNSCLFFNDNKAALLNFSDGDTAWFYWEFPQNIRFLGAYNLNGKLSFLCLNTDSSVCFTADLKGASDTFLADASSVSALPISALVRTKKLSLGCDNSLKKLDFVTVNLKGDINVSINDRLVTRIKSSDSTSPTPFKITPALCGINLIDISFSSSDFLSLGSIDIGYTVLDL